MFRSCEIVRRENLANARCPRIRNISLRKHSIGKYAQAPRSNRSQRTLHLTAAIVNILTAEISQRLRERERERARSYVSSVVSFSSERERGRGGRGGRGRSRDEDPRDLGDVIARCRNTPGVECVKARRHSPIQVKPNVARAETARQRDSVGLSGRVALGSIGHSEFPRGRRRRS